MVSVKDPWWEKNTAPNMKTVHTVDELITELVSNETRPHRHCDLQVAAKKLLATLYLTFVRLCRAVSGTRPASSRGLFRAVVSTCGRSPVTSRHLA